MRLVSVIITIHAQLMMTAAGHCLKAGHITTLAPGTPIYEEKTSSFLLQSGPPSLSFHHVVHSFEGIVPLEVWNFN